MTNFVYSLLLSWKMNSEPDVVAYRVYERCSTNISRAGTFTDYTEVRTNWLKTAIPPNTYYSFCVTAINRAGEESAPSAGIWVVYVRPPGTL